MFSEELKSYINHGSEETNIEYKASMRWYRNPTTKDEKVANVKFIRTMLAMSNHIYGGIIVVGVKQKENGICEPKGMRKRDYDSFNYDHISRSIKEHSNPWIQFKISRDSMELNGKELRFVVIQVMESPELPVICTKSVKVNDSQPAFSQNLLLRENAIYIRAKAPIESREISSIQEWRDLIDRLLEKGKKELLRKMPCAKFISEQEEVLEAAEGAKVVGIEDYEAQLKRETR